jgi:putative peptide zinc metalloprotease protein
MDGSVINAAGMAAATAQAETKAASIAASIAASKTAIVLPLIRQELRLLPAAANHDGSPAWMVQDPVNNRFFRIGWMDFEMLKRWSLGSLESIAASVSHETTLAVGAQDVGALLAFLEQHSLLQVNSLAAFNSLKRRAALMTRNPYQWLLHNYLFFRIPLLRPHLWLARIMPFLNWLFSPVAAVAVLLLTLTGIFLVARQWETFSSTAVDHLTWAGALGYASALVFAKMLHELGHAITATRYGVRVAHMGVAMLVMFPMLYTDTGESWKLTQPRQRLAIASAGIVTELALAGLATLAWSLVPDGGLKNALFFLATTSWVLTVLLNISPFMRFDGYFILTDILDFPNLHERSSALARTWLRRTLLGLDEPWSERTPGQGNLFLIIFALATWLYRLTLFLGIALLVYYFCFKVLGIFLMLVELVWFIARPVWLEMSVWRSRKKDIKTNRKVLAGLGLVLFLSAGFVPWHSRIHGVGWAHPERQQIIYSPLAGRIVALPTPAEAGAIKLGQVLIALESPDLHLGRLKANEQAQARAKELLGLSGLVDGEERRNKIQTEQSQYQAEAGLFLGQQSRLQISAAFAGVLLDLDPQLALGVWVQPRQPLAVLIDPTHWTVEVFVAEADVARIQRGDSVRAFLGRDSLKAYQGRVEAVDMLRTTSLPHSILDAKNGGPIATLNPTAEGSHERVPKDAIYRVRIVLDEAPPNPQMRLAQVAISGQSQAWLATVFSRFAAVALRESGF